MKPWIKTLLIVLLLCFIALLFGLNASMKHYQITLSSIELHQQGNLPPDFALNVTVLDEVFSVLFIAAFIFAAFLSGKKDRPWLFSGLMIYTALPFIGLVGYPFYHHGIKFGIILLLTLIYGYPFFPLIITQSSPESIVVPLFIFMAAMPVAALIAHAIGKKVQ